MSTASEIKKLNRIAKAASAPPLSRIIQRHRKDARHNRTRTSLIERILYSGNSPLEIMFRAMQGDLSVTPMMLKAAELAAPYIHPKVMPIMLNARLRSDVPETIEGVAEDVSLPDDPLEAAKVYRDFIMGTKH